MEVGPRSTRLKGANMMKKKTHKASKTRNTNASPERKRKVIKASRIEDGGRVFHRCIICEAEFHQRIPHILNPKKKPSKKLCKTLDEFGIFFALSECLGISTENGESIFDDLCDRFGEPGHWGMSFCSQHLSNVQDAQQVHRRIKELEQELGEIKKGLQSDLLKSLRAAERMNHEEEEGWKEFDLIRNALKNALLPDEVEIKDESDECILENVIINSIEVKDEESEEIENLDFSEPPDVWMEETNLGNTDSAREDLRTDSHSVDVQMRTRRRPVKPKALKRLENKVGKVKKFVKKVKVKTKEPYRFQCVYCPLEFDTSQERAIHRKSNHYGERKPFECDACGEDFLYKDSLTRHRLKVHENEKPFQCDQCSKAYAFGKDLRKHQKLTHSAQANEIVPCPVCHKEYKGQLNLRKHINTFHQENRIKRKQIICELCSKTYLSCQAFKTHQAKEHSISVYEPSVCNECGKVLSDPRSLRKHKQSQHLKTFKFICEICGWAQGLFKSNLDAHMKSAHGAEKGPRAKKPKAGVPEQSSQQSSSTLSRQDINAMKINDGSYPHECYKCGEEFHTKLLLKNHKCAPFAHL